MVLVALIILGALIGVHPYIAHGTTVPPGQLSSWNPAVTCNAVLTSIEGIIGSQPNANGGATYAGGGFIPGIPNKRSNSPPCTVNGNTTFVEIHGVQMLTLTYVVEDCAQYPNGNFCDTTFNFQDPKCTTLDVNLCRIHMEIDQAWKSAGIAPQNPPVTSQLFDIQGFVYWDNGHTNDSWHSFSGWEIHPISAWRFSSSSTPDFGMSDSPTTMTVPIGSTGTATITLNSLYSFAGTVNLSATIVPSDTTASLSLVDPIVSFSPASVPLAANGTGASTMTVSSSLLTTPGTYTITITANSGTISHSATVTVTVSLL